MDITAQEVINFIETKTLASIINKLDIKHHCIKGVLQSKDFLGRSMSSEEMVRLMEWQEK